MSNNLLPNTVHNLDAIEFLKSLPAGSVDLIVTDPPYESLEKHRKVGTTTRLKKWFEIFKNDRFDEFFKEAQRVLKKNSHLYVMCDQETMFEIKPKGEAAGFKFWKGLIWDKKAIGMGYHYRSVHEMICFFEKGKRKLNNKSISDIIPVKRILSDYPTEKPVKLMEILINQSTNPGELVVDPFCGGGAVAVAAKKNNRNFIINDKSQDAIDYFRNREDNK